MTTAKKYCALFSAAAGVCLTTAKAVDDLPKAEPFSHYESMLKHSPFAVATGAPIVGTPDFAKELYVANAGHSDTGDFVTIASTTNRDLKLYLTTKATVDGYSIPDIQWSNKVGETKVTITKDGQVATLGFNEAVLGQPIQNPVPQVAHLPNGLPNIPGRPPGNLPVPLPRSQTVPAIPTPPPHSRSLIRRNGGGAANTFQRPDQGQHSPLNGEPRS
jgi:hypothetical protein